VANQTGRPIAPARKLVAAVLGTISVFIMVFGLGLSSWPIVALGAALLALSIALGMVNVVRRGARAWVAGTGQVKTISDPPMAGAYGRAELQLTVVAPGLPINDVLVRESRVPVGKWPRLGDTLPISVDVDDMRRVRILWDEASDRADDGDPPPPPAYEPAEEYPDDDLLGEPEPPPWATRDRAWGRGPDEPPPPPPPGADPDLLTSPIVVHDTPAGPVLEGQLVDQDDIPSPLPQRARTAAPDTEPPSAARDTDPPSAARDTDPPSAARDTDPPSAARDTEPPSAAPGTGPAPTESGPIPGQGRPAGSRPSPRPRGEAPAAAAATTATIDEGTRHHAPGAAATHAPAGSHVVPEQRAAATPGAAPNNEQPTGAASVTDPHDHDIDLPLDGDPEPPPEFTSEARPAVDQDIIAPPADAAPTDAPPADAAPTDVSPADAPHTGTPTAHAPAGSPVDTPLADTAEPPEHHPPTATDPQRAADEPTITGIDALNTPPETDPAPTQAAHAGATAAPASSEPPPAESPHAGATAVPAPSEAPPAESPHAGATATPAPSAAAPSDVPPSDVPPSESPHAGATAVSGPPFAAAAFTGFALGGVGARQRSYRSAHDAEQDGPAGPWADLDGVGYEPDERTDDVITAYPSARPGPAGAIHGVGITVLVTDLQRSIAFYRDILGFFEIDSGAGSAVLASGDTRLVLRAVHTLPADTGRLIYLNLEVGDVDAVYQELEAKGVAFEHAPRPVNRGGKLELWAATFYDPDGHNIAITQWKAIR
jgi:catechol 2,3-dioxygenase-like lactoylglutathione lyase family enzyme